MPNDISVLVVDDNSAITDLLKVSIENALGIGVYPCYDGMEALAYLACVGVMPKLIISDIDMPIVNGVDLARRLYNDERYRGIPIVLASSYAHEKLVTTPNVVERVSKPYSIYTIGGIVRTRLGIEDREE